MSLKMENVGLLRYGNWILKDLNWEVTEREHWALLGLNGAGKTALSNLGEKTPSSNT